MQPAIGTKSATEFDITVTPTNNVNVKCGVYASDAVAPTADQVYANTGNSYVTFLSGFIHVSLLHRPCQLQPMCF